MSEINNLFATESNVSTVGNRGLSGTAQLTNLAGNIAAGILQVMNEDIESYTDAIKASQRDNNAMDELINRVWDLEETDVDFLKELDEHTVEGMLKSQQSKRSRCKSKAMTMDNYRALMTGAIAENLIRLATGKEKHAGVGRRVAGSVDYTIEELQQLSEDQESLKKEIRNIQSKKSIMKSKADFDESDERYQALLRAEQQLKDMRTSGQSVTIVKVDECAEALSEMLHGVDIQHLKLTEAKELLERISSLVTFNGTADESEEQTESIDEETTNEI